MALLTREVYSLLMNDTSYWLGVSEKERFVVNNYNMATFQ
jgi:hypothetical protein